MIPFDKIRVEVDDCDCCGLSVGVYTTVDGDEEYLGELGRFFTVQDIIDLAAPENVEEPTCE